ncbi:MAG: S8 family serine peptidase [bacterium]|nr:S8 family serine peptidase [bacterium]
MPPQNHRVESALEVLKKDFVVVGKTRVRSWHAWLIIGLCVGILVGVLFVANRSGEFDASKAATSGLPNKVIGIITFPDGKQQLIVPQIIYESVDDAIFKASIDPLRFISPMQKALLKSKTNNFVAIMKPDVAQSKVNTVKSKLSTKQFKNSKEIQYLGRSAIAFQSLNQADAEVVAKDPSVESVVPDRLIFLQSPINARGLQVSSNQLAQLPSTQTVSKPQPNIPPVVVGVIDTGVDSSMVKGVIGRALYSFGEEMSRFSNFFQPWHNSRSFSFDVPQNGGWVNITVSNPAIFGFFPSPAKLQLVVKDETGKVVGQSQNKNGLQSERVEAFAPLSSGGKKWSVELQIPASNPRVILEKYEAGDINYKYWWPSFTPTWSVASFPKTLGVTLTDEVDEKPLGALPSITGIWKKGSFSVHGKNYNLVLSDVYPEEVCYSASYSGSVVTSYDNQIIFSGYDGFSVDTNGDGDYSDITGVGHCEKFYDWKDYVAPELDIDGHIYEMDSAYSIRFTHEYDWGGVHYVENLDNRLTSLNGKVASFEILNENAKDANDFYGPMNSVEDFNGHGTHVAGIIVKQAPSAKIFSSKVFGSGAGFAISYCFGTNDRNDVSCEQFIGALESEIVAGMQGAIDNGARILNLSLGVEYSPPDKCEDFLMSRYIKDVVKNLGVTVIVAAGNGGPVGKTISAPGCVEEAITVGAVSINGQVTDYSSRGLTNEGLLKPDLVAVGGNDPEVKNSYQSHIAFLFPKGVSSRESNNLWSFFGVTNRDGVGKIKMSGTSMAAPQVSAAAALLLDKNPQLTPADIKSILMKSAQDLGLPRDVQGAGLLDVKKALNSI